MRNVVTALMKLMNETTAESGITEVVRTCKDAGDEVPILIGYVRTGEGNFPLRTQIQMIVAAAIKRRQAFRICFDKNKRLEGRIILMSYLPEANLLAVTDRALLSLPDGAAASLLAMGIEVCYLLEPDAAAVEAMRYIHALIRQQSAA